MLFCEMDSIFFSSRLEAARGHEGLSSNMKIAAGGPVGSDTFVAQSLNRFSWASTCPISGKMNFISSYHIVFIHIMCIYTLGGRIGGRLRLRYAERELQVSHKSTPVYFIQVLLYRFALYLRIIFCQASGGERVRMGGRHDGCKNI